MLGLRTSCAINGLQSIPTRAAKFSAYQLYEDNPPNESTKNVLCCLKS
jgi:hypothetical protein